MTYGFRGRISGSVISLFVFLCTAALFAQPTVQLRMQPVTNDGMHLDVKCQIRGSSVFGLASSNLVITYVTVPDAALSAPVVLAPYNFTTNAYDSIAMTNPLAGRASMNVVLNWNEPDTVWTTWTDIAMVRFTTLNRLASATLGWRLTGPGRTLVYAAPSSSPTLLTVDTALGLNFASLPVTLSSFSASWFGAAMHLSWTTESENNTVGFEIERSLDGVAFDPIGKVLSKGSGAERREYSYTDPNAPAAEVLYYRLRIVDVDGSAAYSLVVRAMRTVGMAASASAPYPNPATSSTTISLALARDARVTILLYDLLGRPVQTVARDAVFAAGVHIVPFSTSVLRNGRYLLHVAADRYQTTYPLTIGP